MSYTKFLTDLYRNIITKWSPDYKMVFIMLSFQETEHFVTTQRQFLCVEEICQVNSRMSIGTSVL
jgi:hypothetical protein